MLTDLAFILILGIAGGAVFRLFKLPQLIGMIIAGIIAGPFCLNILNNGILDISADLRQFALVIILTRAGLSLNIEDLKKVGRPAFLLCFLPACFEIAGTVAAAHYIFGIAVIDAAIMGATIAAVSPAVVVPRMIKLMENRYGTEKSIPQMILAGASVDDVIVIVIFTALLSVAGGNGFSAASFLQIPISVVSGIVFGIIIGFILDIFYEKTDFSITVKLLIMLSFSFFLIAAENRLKGIFPISGLLAIMAMSNTVYRKSNDIAKELSEVYNKIWIFGEIILFVLVGAAVDIKYAIGAGISAICILLIALIFRMAGVFVSVSGTDLTKKEKLFTMAAYTPKATVQAAIGTIPLAMGLSCGHIVLTTAVLSILITAPFGAIFIDKGYKYLLEKN